MPARKAPGRRQGTTTNDVGLVVVGEGDRPIPPLPKPASGRLLQVTKNAWVEFWSSQISTIVDARSDAPALRRLFLLYDERERALRAYQAERMTEGSMGQMVVNPFAKEVASLDARIVVLEDRFGLTPHARLKLGVTFGDAARSLSDMNRTLADALADEDDFDDDPRFPARSPGGT
jgi:hypothetical protein